MVHASVPRWSPRVTTLLVVLALQVGVAPLAVAQLNVDRLFPPAVTRGEETLLSAEGKFPSWPVKVWCDREDVTCRADKESGSVAITVAEDAPAGIAWLRFYDDDRASALVPLLIEPTAVTVEVEPNNEIGQATRADSPAVLVGRLDKANDVDCFAVSVAEGETLVADVMAHRVLGSPMDAVLQLVDLSGNVLAQSDDARGMDPQLVYRSKHDAEYVLRLFAFPEVATSTIGFAGAATFVYRMQVTTGPLVDHSLPLVAPVEGEVPATLFGWNLPEQAAAVITAATDVSPPIVTMPGALGWHARPGGAAFSEPAMLTASAEDEVTEIEQLPAIVSGHITRPGQVQRLRFAADAGGKYRVAVHSQASGLKLDSVVTVVDPENGKQLARNDDASASDRDSTVDFTAPGDTPVEIQISDLVGGFGISHAYSASVVKIGPSVSLTLAEDRYRLAADGSVEIPVKIQRNDGFSQNLRIEAVDLPEGVTCESMVSQSKGDSAKEVKLKLAAGADVRHQGPIRIVARPSEEAPADEASEDEASADEPEQVVAVATFSLRDGFAARALWLSVAP